MEEIDLEQLCLRWWRKEMRYPSKMELKQRQKARRKDQWHLEDIRLIKLKPSGRGLMGNNIEIYFLGMNGVIPHLWTQFPKIKRKPQMTVNRNSWGNEMSFMNM